MKILHICLSGPFMDGWNYQDNLITKYQVKLGHKVTVITSQWIWNKDGKLVITHMSDYKNSDGIKILRLPIKGNKNITYKFKKYIGLMDSIKSEKPELIFVHNVNFLDIKIIYKYIKKHLSVKLIVDNHMDFSNSAQNWISKNILHRIWRHYAQLLNPYVYKFYGVLPARVDFLIDLYKLPKEKVELLVMGADDEEVIKARNEEIINNIREKYGISSKDFLIITAGKIDMFKKQTLLLMEAVSKIKNKNIKLIVFGSVEDTLKEEVKKFSNSFKVQYIGWIDAIESYKYFAAADLAVFPGRHSVFWEQVTGQGIPMICKYWEGTTHVDLGGNVKFLYQDTTREIMKAIEEIYNNKELYKHMKVIAMERGMKNFSYKDIAQRCLN